MNIYLIRHGESIMNTGENAKIGEIDNKIWLTEIRRISNNKDMGYIYKGE